VQISLRAILAITACVAGLLAIARWANYALELEFDLTGVLNFAAFGAIISLYIGSMLIAPCFALFAILHRLCWRVYTALAIVVGYIAPLIVVLWLIDFDADEFEDALMWLYLILPLQLVTSAIVALEFRMLHAAGMRLTQVAKKSLETQRSAVGS
jgi:hypothetical protein